ncbi:MULTISPECIES: hypothetical protein [unclassified Francisella]|uniref:hypothetical protein n=1 Tax=unclassified Francisella TaxID=2610885 RepID=UPI002E32B4F2|nr:MULTISPECIES: hypothetical protein [unclassified Francisella]MED7820322.1 hypothetical protein [Francisella sp. 19S2-4]MED7831157.1 hypothetical protein [Francisella sp. 19S2-10]
MKDQWNKNADLDFDKDIDFNLYSNNIEINKLLYAEYNKSMDTIDESIVDAIINLYLSETNYTLLNYARKLSNRFYQLLKGYCSYISHNKICMYVSPNVGVLKQHGFTFKDIDSLVLNWYSISQCEQNQKTFSSIINSLGENNEVIRGELENCGIDVGLLSKTILLLRDFAHLTIDNITIIMQELVEDFHKSKIMELDSNEIKILDYFGRIILENNFSPNDSKVFIENSILNIEERPIKSISKDFKMILRRVNEFNSSSFIIGNKSSLNNIYLKLRRVEIIHNLSIYIYNKREKINIIKENLFRKEVFNGNFNQCLIKEIQYRIIGDGNLNNAYGSMGTNPQVWVNSFEKGFNNSGNVLSEFRCRMYFVYMLNHFCNEIIEDTYMRAYINNYLKDKNYKWQIDDNFIDLLISYKKDELNYLPPIFRYGSYAILNKKMRSLVTSNRLYKKKYNNLSEGKTTDKDHISIKTYNRHTSKYPLSSKESLGLKGNFVDISKPDDATYSSGSTLFKLKVTDDKDIQNFINRSIFYNMKLPSGISGTLDQSLTMAGLVGIGIDSDLKPNYSELYILRMAYITFMRLPYDHSIHEIMTSSKSFGMKYSFNVSFCKDIYPFDKRLLDLINQYQREKNRLSPHEVFNNRLSDFDTIIKQNYIDSFQKYKMVFKICREGYALIRSVYIDHGHFSKEIESLKYPATTRYLDMWDHKRDRSIYCNPATGEISRREVSEIRGSALNKNGELKNSTKKRSVTLLSPNGDTQVFHSLFGDVLGEDYIITMYNYDLVNNKDNKYVFDENAYTNTRWWLGEESILSDNPQKYISFKKLREKSMGEALMQNRHSFNELLVGLNKEALIGVCIDIDKSLYNAYLSLLYCYLYIKNKLGLSLPLFVRSKKCKLKPFTQELLDNLLNALISKIKSDFQNLNAKEQSIIEYIYQIEDYHLLAKYPISKSEIEFRLNLYLPKNKDINSLYELSENSNLSIDRIKLLISFRDFISKLEQSLSLSTNFIYMLKFDKDEKKLCFKHVISYLNICIKEGKSPEDIKLVDIFQKLITILPINRTGQEMAQNNFRDIKITKSAKSLFKYEVTQNQKYLFEGIPGLSLDWVREIRSKAKTENDMYIDLLNRISYWNGQVNVENMLSCYYYGDCNYFYDELISALL